MYRGKLMKIGYARVSTDEQNLERQEDLLKDFGCEKIVKEKFSGTKKDRPGLEQLLYSIRENDIVVVESISRLGRDTLDILNLIQHFDSSNIKFISLKENMDTATPTGKAMLQMMCVIAELERNLLAERVREGINASRKRGVRIGRPKMSKEKIATALRMYDSGEYSIKEIVGSGISQGSLYRALNKRKLDNI